MIKFLRNIYQKWLHALIGFWTALKEEKSLWAYIVFFLIIIGISIWLDIKTLEWVIVIFLMAFMFVVEIINTSIEAAVDTISFQYNVKVKKIKDIASAATLVSSIISLIILLIIFIPKIDRFF